jgi:hypothetical protein
MPEESGRDREGVEGGRSTVEHEDCRLGRVSRQPAARVDPKSLAAARPQGGGVIKARSDGGGQRSKIVPVKEVVVGCSRRRALVRGHGEGVACSRKWKDSVRNRTDQGS